MAGAKRLEELIIWILACELRDGIGVALSTGTGRQDWDFRNQVERSSRSTTSNIAEGYGHFKPRQFAKYLRIARASAMETLNHTIEGRTKKYFAPQDAERFARLSRRVIKGTSSLIGYLDSCDPDLDLRAGIPGDRRASAGPNPTSEHPNR